MVPLIAILDNLGMSELMIVAVVALLLFGKRLPEVASQAGATLAKFRKSLDTAIHDSGVEQEIRKIKSAMPTDMSVRDVARVAARKFEDRLRDEVDIPPISLDAPATAAPANTATAPIHTTPAGTTPAGGSLPGGVVSPNGAPSSAPSTEAHPAPAPKPGIDPASQFARAHNGVHSPELDGSPEPDRGAPSTPTSEVESVERARPSGIPPRPLPPGSVPRE